jgi:enoyl-CoA hydratase/carnithine racemase
MSGTVHMSEPAEGVMRLEIDNPPMNPLGPEMCAQVVEAFRHIGDDTTTRVVILTGRGPSFCAGADLKGEKGVGAGFGSAIAAVARARVPVVAAINGHCLGGGLELALCCDLRIASTGASFVAAGVNMGLIASAWRLPRLIGLGRAKAMLLTGSPHGAEVAERWGLVTALHAPEELAEAALALATRIASRAPLSVEATRRLADRAADLSLREAAAMEAEEIAALRNTADHKEAVAAFREKRAPRFNRR